MSVKLSDILAYINTELTPELFKDYCPNGLQVEGKADISKVVTGVTASQALIDQAIAGAVRAAEPMAKMAAFIVLKS